MMEELMKLIAAFKTGDLAAYAGAAMLLVRVMRESGPQALLAKISPHLTWPKNSLIGKAIVLGSSLVVTTVGALAHGLGFLPALAAAVPVALGAVLGHKVTQAVGTAVRVSPDPPSKTRGWLERLLDVTFPIKAGPPVPPVKPVAVT